MMQFRVEFYSGYQYRVILLWAEDGYEDGYNDHGTVFTGSLSDCEAFIRLKEGGYM